VGRLFRIRGVSVLAFPSSESYQAAKAFWLPDGHIGQHLPVYFNAGLLQSVHELTVSDSPGAAGSADTQNPESAHVTFSLAPVKIGIAQRLDYGLIGPLDETVLGTPVTLGHGQYLLMSLV